jgi:hypothetical protein
MASVLTFAPMHPFELEKKVWTEADFSMMGWHDAPVYAMAFFSDSKTGSNDLVFDLDYIFRWVDPVPPNAHFSFWIAPCTLAFKNVHELTVDMNTLPPQIVDFEIMDIARLDECQYPGGLPCWKWHIETGNGDIYFSSIGYEQVVKQPPAHTQTQAFPGRGQANFSRMSF